MNEINLIDREAAADILDARADVAVLENERRVYRHAANMIRFMAAVDAQPVRRGKWILFGADKRGRGGIFECTACVSGFPYKRKYCPNCGAKMDLED